MDLADTMLLNLGRHSKVVFYSFVFQSPSGSLRVKTMDVCAKRIFYQRKCLLWKMVLLINQTYSF